MVSKYRPAKGARYNPETAQELGEVLETLGKNFSPADVVKAAKPKRSPIHKLFEWDDTEAAIAFRLAQARDHTNHLEVVIKTEAGMTTTKAFHSVVIVEKDESERGYSHMKEVRKDPDLSQQVIDKALAELNGWKQRYGEYQSIFGGVVSEINKVNRKRTSSTRELAAAGS